MNRMAKTGLADLTKMQNADGGWSWTPSGDSDTYMTVLVVSNLKLARDNGLTLVPKMLERGIKFLETHQKARSSGSGTLRRERSPISFQRTIWTRSFLKCWPGGEGEQGDAGISLPRPPEAPRYSQALLALGLDYAGAEEQRNMVVRNLSQFW